MATVGDLTVNINADLTALNAGINQTSAKIKQFVANTRGFQTELQKGATAGAAAWSRQNAAAFRLKETIKNLAQSTRNSTLSDTKKAEQLRQLTALETRMVKILTTRKINQTQLTLVNQKATKALNGMKRVIKDVDKDAKGTGLGQFKAKMTEMAKSAQLALGPLSGIAARITAFSSLATGANIGVAALLGTFVLLGVTLAKSLNNARNFEEGLISVKKTTNLTREEMDSFGKTLLNLSAQTGIVAGELTEIATAAGQLGVDGVNNLEDFTETIAKLTKTTNLGAEEAATQLARILTVTSEAPDKIKKLASAITALGNNFAASEKEIVRVTNEVARAIGIFGVASEEVAALATALRAAGVRAESAGSAIGRIFIALQKAGTAGGEAEFVLRSLTGLTGEKFLQFFEKDAVGAFELFVTGFKKVGDSSKTVINVLSALGLRGVDNAKALLPLIKNSEQLSRALATVREDVSSGSVALENEFQAALQGVNAQLDIFFARMNAAVTVLGQNFLPTIMETLKSFNSMIKDADKTAESIQSVIEVFLALAAALGISKLLTFFGKKLAGITNLFGALRKSAIGFAAVLRGGIFGIAAASIGLLAGGLFLTSRAIKSTVLDLKDFEDTSDLFETMAADAKTLTSQLSNVRIEIAKTTKAQKEASDEFDKVTKKQASATVQQKTGISGAAFKSNKDRLEELAKLGKDLEQKLFSLGTTETELSKKVAATATPLEEQRKNFVALGLASQNVSLKILDIARAIEIGERSISAFSTEGEKGLRKITAELKALKLSAEAKKAIRGDADEWRRFGIVVKEALGETIEEAGGLEKALEKLILRGLEVKAALRFEKSLMGLERANTLVGIQNEMWQAQTVEVEKAVAAQKVEFEATDAGLKLDDKRVKKKKALASTVIDIKNATKDSLAAEKLIFDFQTKILSLNDKREELSAFKSGGEQARLQIEDQNMATEAARQLGQQLSRTGDVYVKFAQDAIKRAQAIDASIRTLPEALVLLKEKAREAFDEFAQEEIIKDLKRTGEELKLELELVGRTNEERRIELALLAQKQAAEKEGRNINLEAMRQQIENNEKIRAQLQQQIDWTNGLKAASSEFLTSAIKGGDSLGDIFKRLADRVRDLAIELLIVKPIIDSVFSAASGGSGGSSGFGIQNILSGIATVATSLFGPGTSVQSGTANQNRAAKGAAFNKGIKTFASGGIVNSPTAFPLARGSTGIMGEAGPEAVIPLARGPGGKLGVSSNGGGGGTTVIIDLRGSNGSEELDRKVREGIAAASPVLVNASVQTVRNTRQRNPNFFTN